jgi:tetrahydromethanopterin S-methyltransferase subunit D
MPKETFTATGVGAEFNTVNGAVFSVDFTTGSGSGSAQLQVKLGDTWVPAAAALTATPTTLGLILSVGKRLTYRWSVTRSGGTIYTFLE